MEAGTATFQIAELHAIRRDVEAFLQLIREIEQPTSEHGALLEYIRAIEDRDRFSPLHKPGEDPAELFYLKLLFHFGGRLSEWATEACIEEVRVAIQLVVETFTPAPSALLKVVRNGKKSFVRTQWALTDVIGYKRTSKQEKASIYAGFRTF
ncbi:MAG: hypothetical protein ABI197_00950 [Granulicella sp.]